MVRFPRFAGVESHVGRVSVLDQLSRAYKGSFSYFHCATSYSHYSRFILIIQISISRSHQEKMGAKSDFRVVIGGGSITGLTLANMLQQHDIDYVVLESYPDIAPQVGASIGILPHGNRILDQLGLFDKILELCPPLDSFHFRDQTGSVICEFRGMNHSMHER